MRPLSIPFYPTYKALAEVGKAEKTIYLCNYLASHETQCEVHAGLNVVENWGRDTQMLPSALPGSMKRRWLPLR